MLSQKKSIPRLGILLAVLITTVFAARAMPVSAAAPTVTSLGTTTGPVTGGTTVVITGTGFQTAPLVPATGAVTFGGTVATYTINNDTTITATAPAHVAGIVRVIVTNADGASANTAGDDYNYTAVAPAVTNLSPATGTSAGGTSVIITGSAFLGLTGAGGVKFGATNATSYTVNSDTQITAIAPAHAVGSVDVLITHSTNGPSGNTAADDYLYTLAPVPTITSVAPNTGSTAGGTSVVITGTGFTGATSVTFGGTAATTFTVTSDTSISATTPAHAAGLAEVVVTTISSNVTTGTGNDFTYTAAGPTVTGLNPTGGSTAGGNLVTITGTGFTGATGVSFGGTAATTFAVINSTTISAQAPAHAAGTVDVLVTTPQGTSPNTAADNYTYGAAPTITALNPASGNIAGGFSVVITGTGFTGTTGVTFGGTAATGVVVNSDTQLTVVAPAHAAGTVNVVVTTPIGASADTTADNFTYTTGPTVTGLAPISGSTAGGFSVVITGTAFTGATAVTVGGTAATSYVVNTATQITAVFPAKAAGTYDVLVTTPTGTSPNTPNDNFTYGTAPVITSISPSSGSIACGTTVTITGSGFTGVTAVSFGATAATSFTFVSDTQITAVCPAGVNGVVRITVTTPLGTTADTAADNFTYGTGATTTFTLYFRWTLIVWNGKAGASIEASLKNLESPDNPLTNDVSGIVTAVFHYNNPQQKFEAFFPGSAGIPGANDITTFTKGEPYWIAINQAGSTNWTVLTD